MTKAFVMLSATHVDVGPMKEMTGAIQQETRLYDGEQCVCTLLVTYPAGSPEWEKHQRTRTLDGLSAVRNDSIQSDVSAGAVP